MSDPVARAAIVVGGAALAVAVAGSALATVGARQLSHREDVTSLRQSALFAGRQIAVDFSAYDYRHLQQDFNRVINESTGTFKSDFQRQSATVQDIIVRVQAVSTAEVASAGLVRVSHTAATVVVAVNRTVKNTAAPNGQSDSFGLQLALKRIDGRWLVSSVNQL